MFELAPEGRRRPGRRRCRSRRNTSFQERLRTICARQRIRSAGGSWWKAVPRRLQPKSSGVRSRAGRLGIVVRGFGWQGARATLDQQRRSNELTPRQSRQRRVDTEGDRPGRGADRRRHLQRAGRDRSRHARSVASRVGSGSVAHYFMTAAEKRRTDAGGAPYQRKLDAWQWEYTSAAASHPQTVTLWVRILVASLLGRARSGRGHAAATLL